ncbi:MAG: type II toxin-antitoxin system RelE/ParE family toxin [Acidobacteria bacterium]|nr:type II toxin-antitoxin system RelE/ParE family toxin [Acidobacteriota bacterium]MBV9185170.1 type II toxin-antitoxin system RelE/ParE family toxin [Acidobacteriota bacterium]
MPVSLRAPTGERFSTASNEKCSAIEADQDRCARGVRTAGGNGLVSRTCPRVAERFTAEARKTLQLIKQFPQIGGQVSDLEHDRSIRQMPIRTFPYHIVFVNLIDTIEVVAFAHNRRRPAYFVARLRR